MEIPSLRHAHQEKTQIAQRFLVPKQTRRTGRGGAIVSDETILAVISDHARGGRPEPERNREHLPKVARKRWSPAAATGWKSARRAEGLPGKAKFRNRKAGETSEVGGPRTRRPRSAVGSRLKHEPLKGSTRPYRSVGTMQESARAAAPTFEAGRDHDADPDFREKKAFTSIAPKRAPKRRLLLRELLS